jgi:hypothetical protein
MISYFALAESLCTSSAHGFKLSIEYEELQLRMNTKRDITIINRFRYFLKLHCHETYRFTNASFAELDTLNKPLSKR